MAKIKIGQEKKVEQGCKTQSMLGLLLGRRDEIVIEHGDRVLATRSGVKILSGEGKGKIIQACDVGMEVDLIKYDYANISNLIFKNMKIHTEIEEAIDNYGISDKEIREVIEDTLREII